MRKRGKMKGLEALSQGQVLKALRDSIEEIDPAYLGRGVCCPKYSAMFMCQMPVTFNVAT